MAVDLAKANHPSYAEMLLEAVEESKDKKGCSRAAILNFITKKYQLESRNKVNQLLNKSIIRAVKSGRLIQKTGSGTNGRFVTNISLSSGDNKNALLKPKKSPVKKLKVDSPMSTSETKNQKTKKSLVKKSSAKKEHTAESLKTLTSNALTKKSIVKKTDKKKSKKPTKKISDSPKKSKNAAEEDKKVVSKETASK